MKRLRSVAGYAIVQEVRAGGDRGIEILGLVDRAKTRRQWWTSDDPSLLIRYGSRRAADSACGRLRFNNATVVPFRAAKAQLEEQRRAVEHAEAMDAVEAGWDGHKVWGGGHG